MTQPDHWQEKIFEKPNFLPLGRMPMLFLEREKRKTDYSHFCEKQPDLPIFLRPWWLDVDAENWDVVLYWENGKVVGALPYCFTKLKFFRGIGMPSMAPYQGFYLNRPSIPKKSSLCAWEQRVVLHLFSQLPAGHFFYQHFFPETTDWLSMYRLGFRQTTRYTHVLNDISQLRKVWENFEKRARYVIRRAQLNLQVKEEEDPAVLFLINDQNL